MSENKCNYNSLRQQEDYIIGSKFIIRTFIMPNRHLHITTAAPLTLQGSKVDHTPARLLRGNHLAGTQEGGVQGDNTEILSGSITLGVGRLLQLLWV